MNSIIEEKKIAQLQLHWLHGLEEYFNYEKHPGIEKFQDIKKALFYGNPWKIRNLVLDEIRRGETEHTSEFIQLIFNKLIDYEYISHRKVLNYISHCIDDNFLKRVSIWSAQCQEKVNFNDHFSRGQIQSKIWLIEQLQEILQDNNLGTVVHYGGWYATVAYFLFEKFNINQYYNIEADPDCVWISDLFNYPQHNSRWKFKGVNMDVNDIKYDNDKFIAYTNNKQNENIELSISPSFILNTSCEHMDDTWYNNLPYGSIVALQTNDYFSNEQHINCCHNLQEVIEKYPMQELYYSGELDTELYKRFMLIGKK